MEAAQVPGIYAAIAAVMAKVRGVDKDRVNPHHKFKYTGHDDVTLALHDAFVDAGIVQVVSTLSHRRTDAELVQVNVEVRWVCTRDGTEVKVESWGEAGMYKGEQQSLQVGKAVSYAVKMAQLKTFMLIGGAPDPEQDRPEQEQRRHGPEGVAQREALDSGTVRESDASDEQVRLFEDEYKAVVDQKGLDKMRAAVSPYLDRMTEAQYDRLRVADESAASLVSGGA